MGFGVLKLVSGKECYHLAYDAVQSDECLPDAPPAAYSLKTKATHSSRMLVNYQNIVSQMTALSPGVKRPGREVDHSPLTSTEVKKMWIYTSTPIRLNGVVLN
jgi:hypothetical protein